MFYLQLRNELWKLFAKKRTYIGFLMFLLAQNVIILVFRFTNGPRANMMRTLEGNGYLAQEFISALTVATFMLLPIAYLLLPLYVSLVGGDLVAKEAEDGTLRMILSRPISFVFVNFIMQNIPYFRDLQHWFLTYHLNIWQLMFAQPVPWWRIGESVSLLAGFNLTFLVIGATAFQVRDIKS